MVLQSVSQYRYCSAYCRWSIAVRIHIAVHIAVNIKSSVFLVLQIAVHIAGGVLHCVVHRCRSQLAVKLRQLSMFGQRPEHHSAALSVHCLCKHCGLTTSSSSPKLCHTPLSALTVHAEYSSVGSAQVSSPQTTLLLTALL